jgi:hypothetical protein
MRSSISSTYELASYTDEKSERNEAGGIMMPHRFTF